MVQRERRSSNANKFAFDSIGYGDVCQVHVVAIAPNCESNTSTVDASTHLDCPEAPEPSCDIVTNDDTSTSVLSVEFYPPMTGNTIHVDSYQATYFGTIEGPNFCPAESMEVQSCSLFVPTNGIEGCEMSIVEICGFGSPILLWDVCPYECGRLESFVGNQVIGEANPDYYDPLTHVPTHSPTDSPTPILPDAPSCIVDCSMFDLITDNEVDDCSVVSAWLDDSCMDDCSTVDTAITMEIKSALCGGRYGGEWGEYGGSYDGSYGGSYLL